MLSRTPDARAEALSRRNVRPSAGSSGRSLRSRPTPRSRRPCAESVRRLDELFLIVVVGEFNAGKSSFINALIGRKVLEEGATPTTRRVQVLAYGPEPGTGTTRGGVDVVYAPVEALRDLHIVDTPGHQRHLPGARGDHHRLRAARRLRPVRHLRGPALHRDRARLHRDPARVGQEDRAGRQQGRHPRDAEADLAAVQDFVQPERDRAAGRRTGGVRRLGTRGPARQARRRRVARCRVVRGARALSGRDARRARAAAAQAAESDRGRAAGRRSRAGRVFGRGAPCSTRISAPSTTSTGSRAPIART